MKYPSPQTIKAELMNAPWNLSMLDRDISVVATLIREPNFRGTLRLCCAVALILCFAAFGKLYTCVITKQGAPIVLSHYALHSHFSSSFRTYIFPPVFASCELASSVVTWETLHQWPPDSVEPWRPSAMAIQPRLQFATTAEAWRISNHGNLQASCALI